jgi:hypothetical protein
VKMLIKLYSTYIHVHVHVYVQMSLYYMNIVVRRVKINIFTG